MKVRIKFENIFVILSALFIFGCCCFYGARLVKYYKVFNPKTEDGEKTVFFSTTIRRNNPVITEGDGLYIYNGDFVFKGNNINNYVKYEDKIWRIISVSRNGSIKLILDESLTEMNYDDKNNDYDKSQVYNYIKENMKLDTTNLVEMDICLNKIDDINDKTCDNKITDYVSLPSLNDYINSVNLDSNESYINNTDNIWLYNKNNEDLAWNITEGKLTQDKLYFDFSVKATITLNSKFVAENGDGTKDKPYVVKVGA